jgi:hydrogenase maturation protease
MNHRIESNGPRLPGKTLILGLGNTLLGDEGVGVKTAGYLQDRQLVPESVQILDGGTLSFILAGPIEDADNLIVIDAAQLDGAPGTIRLYEGGAMDRLVMQNRHNSVHEVSLSDLLFIARLSGRLPERRALIGIQPGCIDWSDRLTEPVADAIPVACDLVQGLLLRWGTVGGETEQLTGPRSGAGHEYRWSP